MTKPVRSRSSYTLLVGLLALLIVAGWTMYQIYSAVTKSQITERQAVNINPIEGVLKKEDIDNLDQRRKFSPADFSPVVLNTISVTSTESGTVR